MPMSTTSGSTGNDDITVVLQGRITAYTAAPIWQSALDTLIQNPNRAIVVDTSRLSFVDDIGIALPFDLIRRERPPNPKEEIRALAPNLAALVRGYNPKDFAAPARGRWQMGILEHIGRATAEIFRQAIGEDPGQLLKLATARQRLANTTHGLVALSIQDRRVRRHCFLTDKPAWFVYLFDEMLHFDCRCKVDIFDSRQTLQPKIPYRASVNRKMAVGMSLA